MNEQSQAPGHHEGSLNFFRPREPRASENMNRATRVPASTVVRMNKASNMTAKWYQKDFHPAPPKILCMISAMPMANVGAPPVREMIDFSPTSVAACENNDGSTSGSLTPPGETRPSELAYAAAVSGVGSGTPLPVNAAGAFIAK